jgi:putative heme iron utilization protein
MLDERKEGDPLEGARVMLMGTASVTDNENDRRRYLARQPEAQAFAGFADFGLYCVDVEAAHLVAGFGRIVDLTAGDMRTMLEDAESLLEAEPDIVDHLNAEHAETLRLYATKLLGAPDGDWKAVGCDPEGLELQLGRAALRLPFRRRVASPGAVRHLLKELADEARVR